MESDFGILPQKEHYACAIDLYGRAGHLEKAKAMIETKLFEPDEMLLKTLLGACRFCGDIELASQVAKTLLELEPEEHCAHVILSEMYGRFKMWYEKASVMRRQRGADVGCLVGRNPNLHLLKGRPSYDDIVGCFTVYHRIGYGYRFCSVYVSECCFDLDRSHYRNAFPRKTVKDAFAFFQTMVGDIVRFPNGVTLAPVNTVWTIPLGRPYDEGYVRAPPAMSGYLASTDFAFGLGFLLLVPIAFAYSHIDSTFLLGRAALSESSRSSMLLWNVPWCDGTRTTRTDCFPLFFLLTTGETVGVKCLSLCVVSIRLDVSALGIVALPSFFRFCSSASRSA
ncbi:putative pentatricopeptide repeat-containing protein, partial [Mucuna pruriens]